MIDESASTAEQTNDNAPLPPSPIEKLLADARLRLVETGTRNRLVHTPRANKRTKSLPILGANADSIFSTLARAAKPMRFSSLEPQADFNDDFNGPNRLRAAQLSSGNGLLQTNLAPEKLEKRLLTLFRDAKTAEEEQGINILFLAIGFLRWYEEDHSDLLREAPLVILPVLLTRDVKHAIFELRIRDEDIATNQAVQERLRNDFGIVLPEIPEDEEWKPTDYFGSVRQVISGKSRWSIDDNGVELGFYSFAKLLMIRDLEPESWSNKSIIENELLRALLSEGFREERPPIADDAQLDKLFAPADLIQVVDADSSQTIVIETVRAGRNLVVQGPPGTGKSQTITNIIASAVHDGKSVLFVAEKMAALDVVRSRLKNVGLGSICLELHSRSSNKKSVLTEIEDTLNDYSAQPDGQAEAARLAQLRAGLNDYVENLHAPVNSMGITAREALSGLIAATENGVASYPPLLAEAANWTHGVFLSIQESALRLIEITQEAGPLTHHPFYGVGAQQLQPTDLARLSEPLGRLAESASTVAQKFEELAENLGIDAGASLVSINSILNLLKAFENLPEEIAAIAADLDPSHATRIAEAAHAGKTYSLLRAAFAEHFVDAAWETPMAALRLSLTSGLSFFGRVYGEYFWGEYGKASKTLGSLLKSPLPKEPAARIKLIDQLIEAQKARDDFRAEDGAIAALAPLHWRGEKTRFDQLEMASNLVRAVASDPAKPRLQGAFEFARRNNVSRFNADLRRLTTEFVGLRDEMIAVLRIDLQKAFGAADRDRIPLRSLAAKAHSWKNGLGRYDQWRRLAAEYARLRTRSGKALAEALANGDLPADKAKAIFDCTRAEAVWKHAISARPELQQFHGQTHDGVVKEFRDLEKKRRRTTVNIIRGRHADGIPRGEVGAMGVIRSEIARKRGHMPLRKLFRTVGSTLLRIKPVLLMSPISVAQFLPPGSVGVDLLVIDEASQVRPEDALGLVARAKQIVVVGDNKQLPPTSFFDRVVADEEVDEDSDDALGGAAKATDLESILALCEARGLNSAMLRWHYRSRHPSLIEVSNAEFYKRLVMPPAPTSERSNEGLIMRKVAGAYDRGGKRINMIEAEAVADAVAEHARANPELSLGVVTFSTAQRDAITDLLEAKRRNDDVLDEFLNEGQVEDCFVKNLENVQGDERDVILVSVGYGPRIAGARLGPVGIHREFTTAAVRWIMAEKLSSVLSARMAMRLNSLSLQKKFSIR